MSSESKPMKTEYESTLCNLIDQILERPGMYLGIPTITGLFHFLGGYSFRIWQEEGYIIRFDSQFRDYVVGKSPTTLAVGWLELLRKDLPEDEAFEQFCRLYHRFMQETEYGQTVRSFLNRN